MKSLKSFINESIGASLKDRTPDRFVKEKPTNQILLKQIEKWNKQINSYKDNIWEFVDSDVVNDVHSYVSHYLDETTRAYFGIFFNMEFSFSPENLFYVTDIKDDEINEVFKNLNSSQKNYLEKQFSLKCGMDNKEVYLEMTGPAFLYKFLQYCEKTNDYKRTIKNADGSLKVMDNSVELSFSFESTDELTKYCKLTVNIFKEALNNMCLDIWNKLTK